MASEIGEIDRFASPIKLTDRRGSLAKKGPRYLRLGLDRSRASMRSVTPYAPISERARARRGAKRGTKIVAVTVASKLAESI